MTMITFSRSGGIAGIPIHYEVDLNNLPADTAQALLSMIQDADFFNIPEDPNLSSPARDDFQYTIIVEAGETDRHALHIVRTSDSIAPEALKPLIEALSNLAHVTPAGR